MHYIEGESRKQSLLFPSSIDEYITDDNIVRFIDAFVNELDLDELGFTHTVLKQTGRPPYKPSDLLKLYIYGYFNKIRTSRKLENECHRNLELMWLLQKLAPDHKTISDFRKNNKQGIIKANKYFILICKEMELVSTSELFGIDGSKFAAVNSNNRNYSLRKLKKLQEETEKQISDYLITLDTNDRTEQQEAKLSKSEIKSKLKDLEEKKEYYDNLMDQIEKSGETQISLTDPDSRIMKDQQNLDVCYNGQISTSETHKLIVACDVTNQGNDLSQLYNMAVQTKENLGLESLSTTADRGYFKKIEIKKCHDDNITCFVPAPLKSHNKKKGMFTEQDFTYDKINDTYICPAGNVLTYTGKTYQKHEIEMKPYRTAACKQCKLKSKCTTSKDGRKIYRWVDESIIDKMQDRMKKHPEIKEKRKELVEHPFGTMKRTLNFGYFLTKGLKSVKAEFNLSVLVYNIKRVLNILGFKGVMEMIKEIPLKNCNLFFNIFVSIKKYLYINYFKQNCLIFRFC